jgi:hypothetical protein
VERHTVDARVRRGRVQPEVRQPVEQALIATVVSIRANGMPRHTRGPAPNVSCAMFVRFGSKRSGLG